MLWRCPRRCGPHAADGCGAQDGMNRLVDAQSRLNRFFRRFVDQTTADFPREHREAAWINRVLRVPPDFQGTAATLFLPDPTRRYASVLLLGIEHQLLLLNVLTLAVMAMWTESATVAAATVYLVDWAVSQTRAHLGERNLAKKSLVDERFLI